MEEAKIEGVGVPVPVSGAVEFVQPTGSSPEDRVEALRRIEVFADLPGDQLKWFADNVEELRLSPGEILFRKGEPADVMAIYLEGEVHAYRDDQAHDNYVYIARAGERSSEEDAKARDAAKAVHEELITREGKS